MMNWNRLVQGCQHYFKTTHQIVTKISVHVYGMFIFNMFLQLLWVNKYLKCDKFVSLQLSLWNKNVYQHVKITSAKFHNILMNSFEIILTSILHT